MEVWKWVRKCVCEGVETWMVSNCDGDAAGQVSFEVWKCRSVMV